MVDETTQITDESTTFKRGQDASKTPDDVSPFGFYTGINVSTEKGCLSPRFSFKHKILTFPKGGVTLPNKQLRSYKNIFADGKFQALIPYTLGQEFFLIVVISGVIFLINQDTYQVKEIPIAGGSRLDQNRMRVNWADAGKYLVLFDYPSYPVIIENALARRADPAKFEVPISTQGAYNQNRLFIVNGLNEFTAGDPAGDLLTPNAPITFTEVLTPGLFFNQFFQLTSGYGNNPITAVTFLQKIDENTEIGTLLVATSTVVWSYQTQKPRGDWVTGTFGAPFVVQSGFAGPRSFSAVNSDVYYVDAENEVRSLSMSRDEQTRWSKVPISKEVDNWLKPSDRSLTKYTTVTYFRNMVFISANPFYSEVKNLYGNPVLDVSFGGFVVLDLANVATLISKSGNTDDLPAWDGLWTGIRPLDIVTNNKRCFAISKDDGSTNRLYEIDPSDTVDIISKQERYIKSSVQTKNYDFKDPMTMKELDAIDFIAENVKGNFQFQVSYKPSHSPSFILWNTFNHEAPYRICEFKDDCTLTGLKAHSFLPIRLGPPNEGACDPMTQIGYDYFSKIQLKLDLTGAYWQFRSVRAFAIPRETPVYDTQCETYPRTEFCLGCNTDWLIPDVNLCQPTTT